MSNGYFKFKQFTVWHDRCAMKVGTDGVLLGACVDVSHTQRVLDVGTGTGLVALMLAQRCPEARITAVEIVAEAAGQAAENVAASPWADRIDVVCADFKSYAPEGLFDTIVSNPPYFSDSLLPPDGHRTSARHTTDLDLRTLVARAARLLTPDGRLTLIIPTEAATVVAGAGVESGLTTVSRLSIVTRHGQQPKRILITMSPRSRASAQFNNCSADAEIDKILYMEDENRNFTDEYRSYVSEFYLKM